MDRKLKNKVIGIGLAVTILVLVTNFALWMKNSVFNEQKFVAATEEVMLSEESRNAFAAEITESALNKYPLVDKVLGDTLEKSVASLMGTKAFATLTEKAAGQLYSILTTKNPKDVVIYTANTQDFLNAVVKFVAPQTAEKVQNISLPDKVVLVSVDQLPSLYNYTYLVSFWPVMGAVAIGLLVYLVGMVPKKQRSQAFTILGVELAAAGTLTALMVPAIEPAIVQNISNANVRSIMNEIYRVLSRDLIVQTWAIVLVGIIMVASALGWNFYSKRKQATAATAPAPKNGKKSKAKK